MFKPILKLIFISAQLLFLNSCSVPFEEEAAPETSPEPEKEFTETSEDFMELDIETSDAAEDFVSPGEDIVLSSAKRDIQHQFTFSYWLNGWRKQEADKSPDILCFETGNYGFNFDLADFSKAHFSIFDDKVDYSKALESDQQRMDKLAPVNFYVEIDVGGKRYRAKTCKAAKNTGEKRLKNARMWESGRFVQRLELQELEFYNAQGRKLGASGSLDIVAWPGSLNFTASLSPSLIFRDGLHQGVNGNGYCVMTNHFEIPHQDSMEHEEFTLEGWVYVTSEFLEENKGYLISKNGWDGSKGNVGFKMENGTCKAVMNVEGGKEKLVSIGLKHGGSVLENTWNHLAMTYDGRRFGFYFNGVHQGSKNINLPRPKGKGSLFIGMHQGGRGLQRGLYDQIIIWDRALPQEEIEAHAQDATKMVSRKGMAFSELFKADARVKRKRSNWPSAKVRMYFKNDFGEWKIQEEVDETWESNDKKSFTLSCDIAKQPLPAPEISVVVKDQKQKEYPVTFDKKYNAYMATVRELQRDFKGGYTDVRNYDELDIELSNTSTETMELPLFIDMYGLANITGLCPVLCDENGVPTGIPVQLSKNWHYHILGNYMRAFTKVQLPPGNKKYLLRIAYGFYGKIPSASHAQLSLVGYGGNGRWDQMAIGCWGETMCMDMDMSCTDVAITDVRLLMARNGANGQKWGWTDAGWGGDWLHARDANLKKLLFSELKTAYLSQGPCLTEVRYDGKYGSNREVDLKGSVGTLRTDDYARTFQKIEYNFDKDVDMTGGWLFKIGRTSRSSIPKIAYGNAAGLIQEVKTPLDKKRDELILRKIELSGEGPWWVSYPGAQSTSGRNWGTGTRALIIRSYKARFGGKEYMNPSISCPVYTTHGKVAPSVDMLLVLPDGVGQIKAGDKVEMDLEFVTLPNEAPDYYGPNTAFLKELQENPNSWKPIYKEVVGNNLTVTVQGGELERSYPIIIEAKNSVVQAEIAGGVGFVPISFKGLPYSKGYTLYQKVGDTLNALDQSVHGNDFWQTQYDPVTNSYTLTYNLPLDGLKRSLWVLKHKEG